MRRGLVLRRRTLGEIRLDQRKARGIVGVLQHIEARDARFEHAVRGVIERGGLERGHLLGEDVHKHLNDEHGGELGWRRAMLTRRI